MSKSKLSVITINFNNQSGLEKTINSVISQTFKNFEYIVIDGGSSDGSTEVIKKYSDKISYWVSEKDVGIYNAMNKGITVAKGEYCLFLNSGDYLKDKDVLDKIFSSKSNADIIYGDMLIAFGKEKIEYGKMPDKITLYQMFVDTLWHPVSFIKKKLFDKFGEYDETFKIVGDYEFFFRTIIVNKVSTFYIPIPVSVFVLGGLSSNPNNKLKEQEERKRVWKMYLSKNEISLLEEKLKKENSKKKKIVYRILNKLKL